MHPLVERMLAKDPTPEALEKILKLQADWEAAEAKRAYTDALVRLKAALPTFLPRDKKVDFPGKSGQVKYTHTSLAGAMEIVIPRLTEYGFSLTWKPGNTPEGLVTVTAKLTHRQGYSEESTLKAGPETGGNKSGPQAVASTVTLLARYACLGMLGLATADMVEPTGESAPASGEKIDTARNMRAMADLAKAGKTKAVVEKYLSKPLDQWTSEDLDKLRAWITPQAPAADLISEAEASDLRAQVLRWQLTPAQLSAILVEEIGRKPANAADIKKAEYAKIKKLFDGLELGAVTLVKGKIERPPDEMLNPSPSGKSKAQLEEEAKGEDIPF